jgi:hypothetical protein
VLEGLSPVAGVHQQLAAAAGTRCPRAAPSQLVAQSVASGGPGAWGVTSSETDRGDHRLLAGRPHRPCAAAQARVAAFVLCSPLRHSSANALA